MPRGRSMVRADASFDPLRSFAPDCSLRPVGSLPPPANFAPDCIGRERILDGSCGSVFLRMMRLVLAICPASILVLRVAQSLQLGQTFIGLLSRVRK